MKIQIRQQRRMFSLWVPTAVLFCRPVQYLANHTARKYAPEAMEQIPPAALDRLFSEMRRIKRMYGQWELVDVESADGSRVKITL